MKDNVMETKNRQKQTMRRTPERTQERSLLRDIPGNAAESRKVRANRKWLRRWLARVETWKDLPGYVGVTFPDLKDGDRVVEKFVEEIRRMVSWFPVPI